MTRTGYQTIIDHYEQCLAQHGDTHRGVDWPNAQDAETRYRVMLEVIASPPDAAVTLLDFGCGAAHLCEYLQRQSRTNVNYIGLDASPKFVELARRKFPHLPFHCIDALADDAPLPEAD
jgi:trans-aconitate methyltransferase